MYFHMFQNAFYWGRKNVSHMGIGSYLVLCVNVKSMYSSTVHYTMYTVTHFIKLAFDFDFSVACFAHTDPTTRRSRKWNIEEEQYCIEQSEWTLFLLIFLHPLLLLLLLLLFIICVCFIIVIYTKSERDAAAVLLLTCTLFMFFFFIFQTQIHE